MTARHHQTARMSLTVSVKSIALVTCCFIFGVPTSADVLRPEVFNSSQVNVSLPPAHDAEYLEWRSLSRRDVVYRPGLFFHGVGQIDITDRLDLSCGLPNKTDNVSLRVSGILRSIVPNSAVFSIGIGSQEDQRSLILKLDELYTSVLIVDGQNEAKQSATLGSSVVDGKKHWFEVRLIASRGSFTSLRLTINGRSDKSNFQETRFDFEDDKVFLGGGGVFDKSYFAGCLANFSLILNGCDLFRDADIYNSSNGGYNPIVVTGGCPNVCHGIHFRGAGYLDFNSSQFTRVNGFGLSMHFKPSSWNGVLLFIRWKGFGYLSVWLSNGTVLSEFCALKWRWWWPWSSYMDCTKGSQVLLLSCNSFHLIEIVVTNRLMLKVSNKTVQEVANTQSMVQSALSELFVGGSSSRGNITGCVTDLRINKRKGETWTAMSSSAVFKSMEYVSFAGCPCRSRTSVAQTSCSAASSFVHSPKAASILQLNFFTEYVFRLVSKGSSGPWAWIRTGASWPEEIRPLVISSQDSCHVNVSWQPPLYPNGIIEGFDVVLQQNASHVVYNVNSDGPSFLHVEHCLQPGLYEAHLQIQTYRLGTVDGPKVFFNVSGQGTLPPSLSLSSHSVSSVLPLMTSFSTVTLNEEEASSLRSVESAHKTSKLTIPVTQTAMLSTYNALFPTPPSTANSIALLSPTHYTSSGQLELSDFQIDDSRRQYLRTSVFKMPLKSTPTGVTPTGVTEDATAAMLENKNTDIGIYTGVSVALALMLLVAFAVLIGWIRRRRRRRRLFYSVSKSADVHVHNPVYDSNCNKPDINVTGSSTIKNGFDSCNSERGQESPGNQQLKEDVETEGIYWEPAKTVEKLYGQFRGRRFRMLEQNQLRSIAVLGSGEFGVVEKSIWKKASGQEMVVAVKTLNGEQNGSEEKLKFLQEAAIMGQFKNKNVVSLIGVVAEGKPLMIVIEFMAKGDLKSVLLSMRPSTESESCPAGTDKKLLQMSADVASGMAYLSKKAFVHRDLAVRNVMVDENDVCKIGDFGLSRDLADNSYYITKGGKIPIRWTAPEAFQFRKYSTASDVWSYGVVLYEIWSLGERPYGLSSNDVVMDNVVLGFRLPPPPACSFALYDLMTDCWDYDHHSRPTFREICDRLFHEGGKLNFSLLVNPDEVDPAGAPEDPLANGHSMYVELQKKHLPSS